MRELRPYRVASIVCQQNGARFGERPSSLRTPRAKGCLILVNAQFEISVKGGAEGQDNRLLIDDKPRGARSRLAEAEGVTRARGAGYS
jgi:hypothetical protein